MKKLINTPISILLSWLLIITLTLLCYWAGLNSAFLFDDTPNLETIGRYSRLGAWHDLALYILEGNSGALGRPLSLASFYINDQTWLGMSPKDFKYTNLLIHLLNGILLFWLGLKLSFNLPINKLAKEWLSLLVCSLWLLHPMHTNTVLYAVQRMTELSALFTIIGLLCYLQGRNLTSQHSEKGWIWLILGCGLSLLLAIFSKENGILLIAYIWVIEYTILRPLGNYPSKNFSYSLKFGIWLPLILLTLMLIKWGWFDITNRPFNTVERLLSETRAIWIYFQHIFFPRFNGHSLLYDDFIISQNIIKPFTTLPALMGIVGLLYISWKFRKIHPILTFGIAWFFAGHLLESTTVALELYFEHRNYLPMYGLMFTLAYYMLSFIAIKFKSLRRISFIFLFLYISFFAIITHNIAQRWSNSVELLLGWLEEHPSSQRILEGIDSIIGQHITPLTRAKLINELDNIAQKNHNDSYLVFRNLKIACEKQTLTSNDLNQALVQLNSSQFIPALPGVLADFSHTWLATPCNNISPEQIVKFFNEIRDIKALQQGEMPQILHYWQAEVHAKQGNLAEAMLHFDKAYALDKNVDLLLLQSTYLMSAGLYTEANNKLNNAESDFCEHWRSCMVLKLRQPDIDNLKTAIQAAQQKANNNEQAVHHSSSEKRG